MIDHPITSAIRVLRAEKVAYEPFLYPYEERGGTRHSAAMLGVDEHGVIKTLIFEDDAKKPLIVLMHGDREVSAKNLARLLGVKSVQPCAPAVADKHSGYQVGGTSPFGTKRVMPVYLERTITELQHVHLNGGKRGFLVRVAVSDLVRVLKPTLVDVAVPR